MQPSGEIKYLRDLVCDAAYDFYGTRLATAGLDQRIKIWRLDEQTGEWSVEDEWKGHEAAISRLAWAHPQHGQFIVSASFDRTVRVWERSPPDLTEQGLNGLSTSTRSERWVERAQLTEAKGSVRSVEWSPKAFGMKVASIATDNRLRLYECIESVSGATNAPTSLMWSLVEEVDIPSLPLTSPVSSSTADINPSADNVPPAAESSGSAAATAAGPSSSTGPTSPYLGATSIGPSGSSASRLGTGSREADGGWDLSWCKEPYWGEVCAVASGVNGVVKIIHFPPAQRPRAVLILDPTPTKTSRPTEQTPSAVPSYAHQARRSDRGPQEREFQREPYAVTTVSWAPSCGRSYHLIASGGRDGRVRIWKVRPPVLDTLTGEDEAQQPETGTWSATVVADFSEHNGPIGRVEWNITGTVLSSAGNDGRVRLWRSTYGNVWRPMGSLDVVQSEDAAANGDTPMD